MALITQRLSADLMSISQANRANQITRDKAEYLIQERYQVAMMQHEVLSALHDSVEHDLAQAAERSGRATQSDTAVVVRPPSSGQVQTQ
jgi:phage I-like protein